MIYLFGQIFRNEFIQSNNLSINEFLYHKKFYLIYLFIYVIYIHVYIYYCNGQKIVESRQ